MTKGPSDDGVVVHAGFPNAGEDGKFGSLSLDGLVVKHRASTFFWSLERSVEELGLSAGSVVVVDRAIDPREGSYVVVAVDDDFLLCRFSTKGFEDLHGNTVVGTFWGSITYFLHKVF